MLTANECQNQYFKILDYYISISINYHPYSINCGYLLFFKTTIMGNTADLAIIQKMIIDTLHKKTQRVITERGGTSCFLLLTRFMAIFIFQQDLAPAHTAKGTKSWFNDHGVTVFDWPTNS